MKCMNVRSKLEGIKKAEKLERAFLISCKLLITTREYSRRFE